MWGKERNKLVIGKAASLRKTIHAFLDLHIEETIVDEGCQVVFDHDFGGDVLDSNAHVGILVGGHWGVEVEIGDVPIHVACSGGGDDTVEVAFDGGEVGSLGADFTGVDDVVATNGDTDSAWVGFFGAPGTDNAGIGGGVASGDSGVWDEYLQVGLVEWP
jgi:hypothetical protein